MLNRSKYSINGLRVLVTVLLALSISTFVDISTYAATVNDVRELLGRQRIEKSDLENKKESIEREYLTTEINNVAASMFELGDKIKKETEDDVDRIELTQRINRQSDAVYDKFVNNSTAEDVLEARTGLDSSMSEVSKLREAGYDIVIDFVPNRWSDEYKKVQKEIDEFDDSYDIGQVGLGMQSPVKGLFEITSPFGSRKDPTNHKRIQMHYGLDLEAPLKSNILAQWNGIVSNVYNSKTYGNVVEIQHGKGLMTRYAHLYRPLVKIGDTVKQYQIIALSGSTGNSTGPHLHFEIYVDSLIANPILLYGKTGASAYYAWAKANPDEIIDVTAIANIKNETATSNNGEYTYGFYNPIPRKESNIAKNKTPGTIVPKLPDGYKRPEPGVLH